MNTVTFGVVGLGMGRSRARLVQETERAVLGAVCDIDEERLQITTEELGCKGYANYEDMLNDRNIDVIYVMTPSGTHLDFAEKAASAGKHVITTKPMEVTVDRANRLIEVCKSNGVQLIVDFEMRYQAPVQQWKAAIDAGELGEKIFAEARCTWWRSEAYYQQGGWRGTWKLDGGGSLANQGVHVVDLLLWLCGDLKVVNAVSDVYNHKIETEDLTVALLQMDNSNPAVIITTTNHHLDNHFGVSITGSLGSASNLEGKEVRLKFEKDKNQFETPVPDWPKSAVEDMVRVLCDGARPHISGEEGIRSVKLINAIYSKAGIR